MKRPRRALEITLVFFIALVAVPAALLFRAVQQEQRNQEMIAAVQRNDENAVLRLLAQGANPNARDNSDTLPPTWWQHLRDLFQHKRSPDNTGTPLLLTALYQHEIKPHLVLGLINAGANVNAYDGIYTPLFLACSWDDNPEARNHQNVEIVSALLRHGANVYARYDNDLTPRELIELYGSPNASPTQEVVAIVRLLKQAEAKRPAK